MTIRCSQKRRGSSLIEVISVLGLLMFIASSTFQLISSFTLVSKQHQESRSGRSSIARLADSIRSDIRGCESFNVNDSTLVIKRDETEVKYRFVPEKQRIDRTQIERDQKSADQFLIHRDVTAAMSKEANRFSLKLSENDQTHWTVEAIQ
ncbi:hypothetical protein Pla22_39770 [Rubripirellula amarantea]|uniref:Uncharacterized protein n=1 Tax=Rubripirellula amarantea TaxID=2527999 RepID=A0A5C5WKL3_9BACT|nr:hypothetical protein [Rubripirellula amarantea]TWT51200.1 hypothetical protein Pla22_39770 [Rubripirellula amarantea]